MKWFYALFGLTLRATQPIPGLVPLELQDWWDLEVDFQGWPYQLVSELENNQDFWFASEYRDLDGKPNFQAWHVAKGQYYRLSFLDGVEFLLNRVGTRLWVRGPATATPEYVATYLLGPVLGIILRLRGIPCLHGSAVAVGDEALVLTGPQGAGKSTTAGLFARQGYPVLTDDISALREEGQQFYVLPADPNICLWPQSVAYLFGTADALPLIISENVLEPDWDKRNLDLTGPGYRFQSEPLPLGAIYLLEGRRPDTGPKIEAATGREAMMSLLANTYGSNFLDAALRAREFEALGRLMAQTPIRRVIPRAGPAFISDLLKAIQEDFLALRNN